MRFNTVKDDFSNHLMVLGKAKQNTLQKRMANILATISAFEQWYLLMCKYGSSSIYILTLNKRHGRTHQQ